MNINITNLDDVYTIDLPACNVNVSCDDIVLIQSFYGVDAKEIALVSQQLKTFLSQHERPAEWVFVEAQRSKEKACFRWVKEYGIKYVFKKFTSNSNEIELKMSLWNIGVLNSSAAKMLFVDYNVVFCNEHWVSDSAKMLDEHDVGQLHSECYDKTHTLAKNIAEWQQNACKDILKNGSCECTLGMTRKAWTSYGGFKAVNQFGLQWFWATIVGWNVDVNTFFTLPYVLPDDSLGIAFKVGCTDGHIKKIDESYDECIDCNAKIVFSQNICNIPCIDIYQADMNEMPVWSENEHGKLMRSVFLQPQLDENAWHSILEKQFCSIDADRPLFFAVYFKKTFKHQTIDCVLKLYKKIFGGFCINTKKQFVIFTSSSQEQQQLCKVLPMSIDVVYEHDLNGRDIIHFAKSLYACKTIKWPANSTIVCLDVDQCIDTPFEMFSVQPKFGMIDTMLFGLNGGLCYGC